MVSCSRQVHVWWLWYFWRLCYLRIFEGLFNKKHQILTHSEDFDESAGSLWFTEKRSFHSWNACSDRLCAEGREYERIIDDAWRSFVVSIVVMAVWFFFVFLSFYLLIYGILRVWNDEERALLTMTWAIGHRVKKKVVDMSTCMSDDFEMITLSPRWLREVQNLCRQVSWVSNESMFTGRYMGGEGGKFFFVLVVQGEEKSAGRGKNAGQALFYVMYSWRTKKHVKSTSWV